MAGYHSLLAPWLGGVSAPALPVAQAGYRSLNAFWMGGTSSGAAATTQDPGGYWRTEYQLAYERLQDRKRKALRIHRDDQEILELLALFTGDYDT